MDTLVLNSAYMPIDRVTWQDAICAIVSGRAEVVHHYEDRIVRSPFKEWRVPSIIRYLSRVFSVFRRGVRFNRNNVYLRDKGLCAYCAKHVSRRDFTFDHVVPKRAGGATRWENIVISCFPCNQKKSDRTPEEARMKLLHKPIRPTLTPGFASASLGGWDEGMPESWKDYLIGHSYWHSSLEE